MLIDKIPKRTIVVHAVDSVHPAQPFSLTLWWRLRCVAHKAAVEDLALANERMSGQMDVLFLLGRHMPRKARTRLVYIGCKATIGQIGLYFARLDAGLDLFPNVQGVLIKLVSAVDVCSTLWGHNGLVTEREVEVLDRIATALMHSADTGEYSGCQQRNNE